MAKLVLQKGNDFIEGFDESHENGGSWLVDSVPSPWYHETEMSSIIVKK